MKQSNKFEVAIIGGGASGLAAALTLKRLRPETSVVVLEKKEQAAKKLAATGNGRCNLSNEACENKEEVFAFFRQSGILLRRDGEGRYYPYSEDAGQLAALLVEEALALGVQIELNSEVKKVEAAPDGSFLLLVEQRKKENSEEKVIHADKVLIATGGKSYPSMGTTGDGYVMARKLGHTTVPPAPGLTAVCTDMAEMKMLKGLRAKAGARLLYQGDCIAEEPGEIQFREDSISGICIMNLSNHIKPHGNMSFEGYEIASDFACEYDREVLENYMKTMRDLGKIPIGDALKSLVKGKLCRVILIRAGFSEDRPVSEISDGEIERLIGVIKDFRIPVTGLKGWKEAQVTCGGVRSEEVRQETMESKLVPGLYFSGEVMEYAGPCGGFNLHYAWLTGISAAKAIAAAL